MNENELNKIKYDANCNVNDAIDNAIKLIQSDDYKKVEKELIDTKKHAQEDYEFYKVMMARFCITENHLESTTKTYLIEIGNQLEKIQGIKK